MRSSRARFFFGVMCLTGAVLLFRLDGALNHLPELLRRLLLSTPRSAPWFNSLPATSFAAVALVVLGSLSLVGSLRGPTTPWSARFVPGAEGTVARLAVLAAAAAGVAQWFERSGGSGSALSVVLWGAILGAVGAVAVRWDRSRSVRVAPSLTIAEIVGLTISGAALFALYVSGNDSWRYSFIGDEYGFYWYAEGILGNPTARSVFEASGCFEFFPHALSMWQALFMEILGPSNLSWRASMAGLFVLCLPPFYLVCRNLATGVTSRPRLVAAFGCVVCFLSELMTVWARIGKPHASFVPALVLAVAFYLLGRSRGAATGYVGAGAAVGAGLYLSSLGFLVAGAAIAVLWMIDVVVEGVRGRRWPAGAVQAALLMGAGFVVIGAPVLVQLDYFQHIFGVTMTSTEAAANRHLFWPKVLQSLLMVLTFRAHFHFLWDDVVDPITATLFLVGGAAVLFGRRVVVPLTLFGLTALLAGAMSQYPYPPVTRLMVCMVPVALVAMMGFVVLCRGRPGPVSAVMLALGIAIWSQVKLEWVNPFQRPVEEWMVELQAIEDSPAEVTHALIYPAVEDAYLLQHMVKTFGLGSRMVVLPAGPAGEETIRQLLATSGHLEVRFNHQVSERGGFESIIRAAGGSSCSFRLHQPVPDGRICVGPDAIGRLPALPGELPAPVLPVVRLIELFQQPLREVAP